MGLYTNNDESLVGRACSGLMVLLIRGYEESLGRADVQRSVSFEDWGTQLSVNDENFGIWWWIFLWENINLPWLKSLIRITGWKEGFFILRSERCLSWIFAPVDVQDDRPSILWGIMDRKFGPLLFYVDELCVCVSHPGWAHPGYCLMPRVGMRTLG